LIFLIAAIVGSIGGWYWYGWELAALILLAVYIASVEEKAFNRISVLEAKVRQLEQNDWNRR